MTSRSVCALFACALLGGMACTTADADDCKLQRIASLDFTDSGSLVIPVSLDGSSVRMAIDTGSVATAVDPIVANNLHLIQRRIPQGYMHNVAGENFTYIALLHDVEIGDMHASGAKFLVWPSQLGSGEGRIGGLLGADFLVHYDIDLDFGAHKLSLFSQDHCPGKVVYWTGDAVQVPMRVVPSGHIVVPIKLDGQPFNALLDTGSTFTFITDSGAYNYFRLSPNSPDMTKVSDNGGPGGVAVYVHAFKTLELNGLSIRNPAIHIFENLGKTLRTKQLGSRLNEADPSGDEPDVTLGLSELHHLHLYIAYKEQNLYISPATAAPLAATATQSSAQPASASAPH